MRPLIQQLADQGSIGSATVFVVGAGAGADLHVLRQLAASRLVLVEAHAGQAEMLSRRIDAARGEEVWQLAVTPAETEQVSLHVISNPGFSSLKPPAGLFEHFPNLHEVRRESVPARSFREAIDELALGTGGGHVLVLDAPGQAFELLDAAPLEVLQAFKHAIVRCSVEPLYEGDGKLEDVLRLLGDVGFDLGKEDPQAIYPQTAVALARNDARAGKLRLEAMLAQAIAERELQVGLVKQRGEEIDRLKRDHDRLAALAQERMADLEKARQRAAEQEALVVNRDQQLQKLAQERDSQARLAAERDVELDKAARAATEQQKLIDDKEQAIRQLTLERDKVATQFADSQAGHDALSKRIEALEQELLGSRQTASLSVRLQTLREADLKDLQVRYRELMEKNEGQHRLLVKLSERLTVAADYFHQLKLADGEAPRSGSGEQVGKVIEVVKSTKPRTRKSPRKQKKDQ